MKSTVIETALHTSWADRLKALDKDGELKVAFKSAQTMRQTVWRLQNLTDLRFTTWKDGDIVIVKRTA